MLPDELLFMARGRELQFLAGRGFGGYLPGGDNLPAVEEHTLDDSTECYPFIRRPTAFVGDFFH